MLPIVPALLAKLAVIWKIGMRSISQKISSLIFLNIYTPPQHALTHNSLCFKVIDKANSKFYLKIKEAFHVNWRKPNINPQQNHLFLTLLRYFLLPLLLSVFVCFSFAVFCNSLSSIVSNISTLIIGTFYCLNYTLLLLRLFVTHLVLDFNTSM